MTKKFFNTVTNMNKAQIYIYGDIDDYKGKPEDIVSELLDIQSSRKDIEVHINSNGGEVYSGIAIINALRQSTANITVFIDGIAASIASVIALCGKPLYMSRYARIMLHSVKAGVYGDKNDLRVTADEVESLENTLCELIASKVKKTPEEIHTQYFDGKDHWITAAEALSLGLIDGIYDAEPVPENSTTDQIYKIINNRLSNQTQKTTSMNIDDFKKRTSFVNAATEADVLRIIDSLETEAGKVPGLTEEVTGLKAKVKVFEDKETAAVEAERTALLDAAVADERIKQPQRAHFEALLKADPENGKAVLNSLTPKKRVMNTLTTPPENHISTWDAKMDEIRKKNEIN